MKASTLINFWRVINLILLCTGKYTDMLWSENEQVRNLPGSQFDITILRVILYSYLRQNNGIEVSTLNKRFQRSKVKGVVVDKEGELKLG